jgi:hypothetical protein
MTHYDLVIRELHVAHRARIEADYAAAVAAHNALRSSPLPPLEPMTDEDRFDAFRARVDADFAMGFTRD